MPGFVNEIQRRSDSVRTLHVLTVNLMKNAKGASRRKERVWSGSKWKGTYLIPDVFHPVPTFRTGRGRFVLFIAAGESRA